MSFWKLRIETIDFIQYIDTADWVIKSVLQLLIGYGTWRSYFDGLPYLPDLGDTMVDISACISVNDEDNVCLNIITSDTLALTITL